MDDNIVPIDLDDSEDYKVSKLKMLFYDVRRWFTGTYVGSKISNAWYWFRTHTWNRYHIVDMRNRQNGYEWGWIDCSEGIMFASFALLTDFVEKEMFQSFIDWDHKEMTGDKEEIIRLYEWWKHGRQEEQERVTRLFEKIDSETGGLLFEPAENGCFKMVSNMKEHDLFDEWMTSHKNLEVVDDEMLMRLIKIRHRLWT